MVAKTIERRFSGFLRLCQLTDNDLEYHENLRSVNRSDKSPIKL